MNPAECTITVRVRPGASRSRMTGTMADGSMKISVAALAEDGAANEELIRFLAKYYGVPKNSVKILSGMSSRRKIIQIQRG
jgi:uncharacterized protein (TIGR00251 family)